MSIGGVELRAASAMSTNGICSYTTGHAKSETHRGWHITRCSGTRSSCSCHGAMLGVAARGRPDDRKQGNVQVANRWQVGDSQKLAFMAPMVARNVQHGFLVSTLEHG